MGTCQAPWVFNPATVWPSLLHSCTLVPDPVLSLVPHSSFLWLPDNHESCGIVGRWDGRVVDCGMVGMVRWWSLLLVDLILTPLIVFCNDSNKVIFRSSGRGH